jgi:MscS family membrane protein
MTASLFLMPNWKWIGLAIAIVAGFLLKSLLRKLFHRIKNASWAKSHSVGFVRQFIETAVENPLAWITTCLFWHASIESLSLPAGLDKYLTIFTQLILSLNVIILVYRAVEAFGKVLVQYTLQAANPLDDQLAPMLTKVLKVFVVIFGVLIALQNFGVNVMSVLAGLGLGGLALALAAQDTAANVFGSITIVADRPFQIGDWIKVGDTEGIVEDIGFRSTRIRTFYNSLITIPNSTIAKEKIDNMSSRSVIRVRHTIGLTYDATSTQMKSYMQALSQYLASQPDVKKEDTVVKFVSMGDFSLQILVIFFIQAQASSREREIQEDFLFFAMKTAESMKLEFAFPTATHYVKPLLNGPVNSPTTAPSNNPPV